MSETRQVIVVGGANMDLTGTPHSALRPGDSNPGHVRLSPGGVGRNIAENLCRLSRPVCLMTLFGEDAFGDTLRRLCGEQGMDLRLSETCPGSRTPSYLCVTQPNGDLHVAVADMDLCDAMTPAWVEKRLPQLNRAALVILDANLPEETLSFLAHKVTAPLAADPVSAAKVGRLKGALARLEMLKPNVPEAETLTGRAIRTDADVRAAAAALRQAGVRRVFLSLGARGVYTDDGRMQGFLPCFPGEVRNTTGCGDAFFAAAAEAWLRGLDAFTSARWGLAAAVHCAASDQAVSPSLSVPALESLLGTYPS